MTTRRPDVCAGAWRALRALVVSLVALMLAVGGHVSGGGSFPSWVPFVALWVSASVLCWVLSGRHWTVRDLFGALLLVQAVMHMTCAFSAPTDSAELRLPMLASHLAATAVSVCVLRHGESVAWSLADALLLRPASLATGTAYGEPAQRGSSVRPWADAATMLARLLVTQCPQRAPPRKTAAAVCRGI